MVFPMLMVQEPRQTSFAFYPGYAKFRSYVRSDDESPTSSESSSSIGKQTECMTFLLYKLHM